MNKAEKLKYPWQKWEDGNGDRFYRITTESGKECIVSQFIGDLLHQADQENKELWMARDELADKVIKQESRIEELENLFRLCKKSKSIDELHEMFERIEKALKTKEDE